MKHLIGGGVGVNDPALLGEGHHAVGFVLIVEALGFGLVIAILLSFLLSKTMVTPSLEKATTPSVMWRNRVSSLLRSFSTCRMVSRSCRAMLLKVSVSTPISSLELTWMRWVKSAPGVCRQRVPRAAHPPDQHPQLRGDHRRKRGVYLMELETMFIITCIMRSRSARTWGSQEGSSRVKVCDRGPHVGALVVIHDVTEQRKNEEMRREFVANVSHELRTPLSTR